jgi:hypothetical protein
MDQDNAQGRCVEGQLRTALGDSYTVVNHAWDGFTTQDVLNGGNVGAVLRGFTHLDNYAQARSNYCFELVKPLETLKTSIAQDQQSRTHYVVISVGGNDFREKLLQPWALLNEISAVQKRYLQILDQVQEIKDKNVVPILMFQYQTDLQDRCYHIYKIFKGLGLLIATLNTIAMGVIGSAIYRSITGKISRVVGLSHIFVGTLFLYFSHRQLSLRFMVDMMKTHTGRVVFNHSLNRLYAPIIARANSDGIPMIQSEETLNPENPNHYLSDIEPSEEGGKVIAQKIAEVIRNKENSSVVDQ